MFGKQQRQAPHFESETASKRYKLTIQPNVTYCRMYCSQGSVTIDIYDPVLTPDSFTDDDIERFLNTIRHALLESRTKVVEG